MQNRLYIGRLSDKVRERDVQDFFRGYGKVKDIIMKNGYGFVDLDDDRYADSAVHDLHGKELCGERVILERARGPGNGRGGGGRDDYGGGRSNGGGRSYDRGSDRDRGYDRGYGGGSSRGGRDTERPAWVDKYGPVIRTRHRMIVENLSSRVSWQDLKDFMRQAGEVTFAEAHKSVKNEGVVEFASKTDIKNAIAKLDGTELNGRKIKLIAEESKHSPSRSRSRSRLRSESRDGSRRRRHGSDDRERSRSPRSRSGSREPSRDGRGDRRRSRSRDNRRRSRSRS